MNFDSIGNLVKRTKQCDPQKLGRSRFVYIDISSVDRLSKQIVSPQIISTQDAPSRARKVIHANDVILSTVRPNLNTVARVPNWLDGEIASTGFCVLRADDKTIYPHYLFYFTQTSAFVSHLTRMATGAGYPAVSDADILESEIPLPPSIAEQKRIAIILNKADRLRRTRRYAQQLSDTFLQSVFVKMCGDLTGEHFSTTPMGELVTITGGGTPSRDVSRYYEGHIPWLTSKDMRGDYIFDTQEHITEEAIKGSATKLVPADSILIVVKSKVLMHRLPIAIARTALCHGQDVKSIQCSKRVEPLFLAQVIKRYEPVLLAQARGANTEGLTLPMLEAIPVPNVPLPLQQKFASIVRRFERLRVQQREATRQADHLFQTLLHRAFRGEL